MSNRYYISAAAEYLHQTPKTLQRWDDNLTFPAHKTTSGHRYYYEEELDQMRQLLSGITREEAAKQLNLSEKTLWRYDRTGRFKSSYTIGRKVYYTQADIDMFKLRHVKKEG